MLTADHLAVAYLEGLQGEGVAETPKHFAGNENEIQRTTINSEIDERSLRSATNPNQRVPYARRAPRTERSLVDSGCQGVPFAAAPTAEFD